MNRLQIKTIRFRHTYEPQGIPYVDYHHGNHPLPDNYVITESKGICIKGTLLKHTGQIQAGKIICTKLLFSVNI